MNYYFEKHINIVKQYEVTYIKPLMTYQELVQIRQKQKTPTKCFMCDENFNANDMIFLGFMKGKVKNQLFCAACAANIKSTLDKQIMKKPNEDQNNLITNILMGIPF